MSPFTPLVKPPWTSGATNFYGRVQHLSLAPVSDTIDSIAEHAAALEFQEWASKTKRPETLHLPVFTSKVPANPLSLLRNPMNEVLEGTGSKPVLSATFGHVVWPLYASGGPVGKGLEPTLDGAWTFPKFVSWREKQMRTMGHNPVFLPS